MRTITEPATSHDLEQVAGIRVKLQGAADSGAVLLADRVSSDDELDAHEWHRGPITGDVVTPPDADDSYGLLYLHGRRFQFEEPVGVYATSLAEATSLPVFEHRYRLAPQYPYPAALNDVIAAYDAIIGLGRPAERILLVGHSAGGTLALSALQQLRATGRPMPGGAAVLSPITDFTYSGESVISNKNHDILSLEEMHQVRSAYLGDADPAGPASPLQVDCSGLPPLLLACGTAEMLRDDTVRFARRAAEAGADVAVVEYEGMPHTFPVMPLDAARSLLDRIAGFAAQSLQDYRR